MKAAFKRIALWAGVAFVLHLLWEAAHVPLYTLWNEGDWPKIARYVLHCTLGDVIIATGLFLVTAVVFRHLDWPLRTPLGGGILMVVIGVAYTAFSEWYNVYRVAAWSYAPGMPLVAGLGITPLLQWTVVPSLMTMVFHRAAVRDA